MSNSPHKWDDGTKALKSLLLTAWKFRWDEQTWAVAVKKLLPAGEDGDRHDLASLIVRLAVVGPCVSDLLLSYARHALCSGLISSSALLAAVCSLPLHLQSPLHVTRLICCLRLVDFVTTDDRLLCGCHDDRISLARGLSHTIGWLCEVTTATLTHRHCVDELCCAKLTGLLHELVTRLATDSLVLCLVHLTSDGDVMRDKLRRMRACIASESHDEQDHVTSQLRPVCDDLADIVQYEPGGRQMSPPSPCVHPTVHCLLRGVVVVELACVRVRPPRQLAQRLLLVARARHVPPVSLVYTVTRTCWECLCQQSGTSLSRYWVQFTLHRLPRVLHHLIQLLDDNEDQQQADDVVSSALCHLAEHSGALLQHVEDLYGGSCEAPLLALLAAEVNKLTPLSDSTIQRVSQLCRAASSDASSTAAAADSVVSVVRAEPTVRSILSTMRVQSGGEPASGVAQLSTVLLHMLGPSQHLVIGAAAGIGQLRRLMRYLVCLNQSCVVTTTTTNSEASSDSRLLVFEMTFLIVLTTVKNYGVHALPRCSREPRPFLIEWVTRFMQHDSPPQCDVSDDVIDSLLARLQRLLCAGASVWTGGGAGPLDWQQLCLHAVPRFCQHLVLACSAGRVARDQLVALVDNCNSRHVCLSVCMVAALVRLQRHSHEPLVQHCRTLLDLFLSPSSSSSSSVAGSPSSSSITSPTVHDTTPSSTAAEHNRDRLVLAQQLMQHLREQQQPHVHVLAGDVDTCRALLHGRHVSSEHVVNVRHVLARRGAAWLVGTTVALCGELSFERDRQPALDAALAVCSGVEPVCCCVALLRVLCEHMTPPGNTVTAVSDGRLASLARTAVTCLLVCQQQHREQEEGRGEGESDSESEEEDTVAWLHDAHNQAAHLSQMLVLYGQNSEVQQQQENNEDNSVLLWPHAQDSLPALLRHCVSVLAQHIQTVAAGGRVSGASRLATHYLHEAWRQTCHDRRQMAAVLRGVRVSCVWRLVSLEAHSFSCDMLASLGDTSQPAVSRALATLLCQHYTMLADDKHCDTASLPLSV